jgi:hypothetical protein
MARPLIPDDDPQQYGRLEDRLRRLEQGTPEEPHPVGTAGEVPFASGWANYAGGFAGASFYKHNGRVYLTGLVIATASHGAYATIFTLPGGYWPAERVLFGGAAQDAFARYDVDASGNVIVAPAVAAGQWASINGISFRAK